MFLSQEKSLHLQCIVPDYPGLLKADRLYKSTREWIHYERMNDWAMAERCMTWAIAFFSRGNPFCGPLSSSNNVIFCCAANKNCGGGKLFLRYYEINTCNFRVSFSLGFSCEIWVCIWKRRKVSRITFLKTSFMVGFLTHLIGNMILLVWD